MRSCEVVAVTTTDVLVSPDRVTVSNVVGVARDGEEPPVMLKELLLVPSSPESDWAPVGTTIPEVILTGIGSMTGMLEITLRLGGGTKVATMLVSLSGPLILKEGALGMASVTALVAWVTPSEVVVGTTADTVRLRDGKGTTIAVLLAA